MNTLRYSEEAEQCLTEAYSHWSDEDKFDMACKANTIFQKRKYDPYHIGFAWSGYFWLRMKPGRLAQMRYEQRYGMVGNPRILQLIKFFDKVSKFEIGH